MERFDVERKRFLFFEETSKRLERERDFLYARGSVILPRFFRSSRRVRRDGITTQTWDRRESAREPRKVFSTSSRV